MEVDDSFRRPGSVPFKWEAEPGTPKLRPPPPQPKLSPPPSALPCFSPLHPPDPLPKKHTRPVFPTRSELRLSSFTQPTSSKSFHCLPSFLFKTRLIKAKKKQQQHLLITESDSESSDSNDYASDLETLTRWSNSDRKSLVPFLDSPSPSSLSPKSAVDVEWASFGLF